MTTSLKKLLSIENLGDYKVHLAIYNGQDYPLDVFVNDRDHWKRWHEYGTGTNSFNEKYIFSLMRFENKSVSQPDHWLFGGIFEVKQRFSKGTLVNNTEYKVELTNQWSDLIGRLKGFFHNPSQNIRRKGNVLEEITLLEILPTPYTG